MFLVTRLSLKTVRRMARVRMSARSKEATLGVNCIVVCNNVCTFCTRSCNNACEAVDRRPWRPLTHSIFVSSERRCLIYTLEKKLRERELFLVFSRSVSKPIVGLRWLSGGLTSSVLSRSYNPHSSLICSNNTSLTLEIFPLSNDRYVAC